MRKFPHVGEKVRLKPEARLSEDDVVWEVVKVDRRFVLDYPIALRHPGVSDTLLWFARREIAEVVA